MHPICRLSLIIAALALGVVSIPAASVKAGAIYHGGWIDFNKNGRKDVFEDPKQPLDARVDNLLAQMNVEEKTMQMVTLYGYRRVLQTMPGAEWKSEIWKDGVANIDEQYNGFKNTPFQWPPSEHAEAINKVQRWFVEETRLGIPVDFTNEGIHGIRHTGATDFTIPPGLGAAFDRELVREMARVMAREARSTGYTNIYGPILDIARDPRWGRVEECFSEDPWLTAELGVQEVLGLQETGVVSTPKHFAVYSVPKGGRDGMARCDPQASWHDVQTIYNVPFKAAFKAGALGTMASYNDYNAVPVQASKQFLTDILRKEWGFKGYVVSDSDAVEYIQVKHHVAGDYKEAVRLAVEAGLNVRTTFEPPEHFVLPLRELINEGRLSMETIDSRVRDVLRVKFIIGLFDQPYVAKPKAADAIFAAKKSKALARRSIEESVVLLKNENELLPLDKTQIKSILVAGPLADQAERVLGGYGPTNVKVITPLAGIKAKLGKQIQVRYAKGCELVDNRFPESEIMPEPPDAAEQKQIDEAVELAKQSDIAIVCLGEDERYVGENASRTSLELMGHQNDLVKAIHATGTPTIVILLNGRAITINWIDKHVPAILEAWFPGPQGGPVLADILFGDVNPSGHLPITFPKTVGQIPMTFPHKHASQVDTRRTVNGVIYPFGHGLSYSQFVYKNLKISPEKQTKDGKVNVSVEVLNNSNRAGDDVVQLYTEDVVSSTISNDKDLRGFQRVHLEPGQLKKLEFTLGPEELQLYNANNEWVVEPGQFKVYIGGSSEDVKQEGSFEITG